MLIKEVKIFPMEGETVENGWLKTNGKRIESFGPMETVPPDEGETVELPGCVLTPGLVDAHTHLGLWEDGLGFEGDDGNEDTDPATPQLRALDAVNPLDRYFEDARGAGVTTVVTGPGSANPVGGAMLAMKTAGRRVDDMLLPEFSAMKFALGENPKTAYHEKDQTPVTRMATAAIIREQLKKAQKYRERLDRLADDPDADEPEYDAKCEALLPVLRREAQAHFHAHRADDIFTALRIAKEFRLDAVLIHCTEGHLIAPELAAENVRILCGPLLTEHCKPELRQQTVRTPAVLRAVGLKPAIITDHPVVPIQYLTLCAALAVKEGLDPLEALRAVTLYPAQILRLDQRIGSLRPGKDADFAVFDGDPLVLATNVRFVAVDGIRVK